MVKSRYGALWTLICIFFFFSGSISAGEGTKDLTAAIQKQYQGIESFRTEFTQKLINPSSKESQTRKGWIVYQRPRRIHWETESPEKEVLILNGKTVWDYYPEEGVAYRYSLQKKFDSRTMLRFISGEIDLRREFNVTRLKPDSQDKGLIRLKLVPKDPDPGMVKAEIRVNTEKMLIKRIRLVDFFGNENILRFQHIQRNCQPDAELFIFEPPEDTRVVDESGGYSNGSGEN